MSRGNSPASFLHAEEQAQVKAAVEAAELRTSGEIRVYVESRAPFFQRDPYQRARKLFGQLGMHNTAERNGVLVYLATKSQRFAIVGDEALHQRVGDAFWKETAAGMARHFSQDHFGDGLAEAVAKVGGHLATFFPRRADDVNELSDEIAFGK